MDQVHWDDRNRAAEAGAVHIQPRKRLGERGEGAEDGAAH